MFALINPYDAILATRHRRRCVGIGVGTIIIWINLVISLLTVIFTEAYIMAVSAGW